MGKQLSQLYTEKNQALQQTQRKKVGSLMVANLDDVLTPEVVKESDFINSDNLKTLVVVVPRTAEETWLETYETLGNGIAQYGPEKNRAAVVGSPVVPQSTRKLYEEGESTIYSVVVLKGQYQAGHMDSDGNYEAGSTIDYIDSFKHAAREKKFIVRDFIFNPEAKRESEKALAKLEAEVKRLHTTLLRWCKSHFGDAFIAWMHLKAVKVFVESVLRYGLPVNFTVALIRPNSGKTKKIESILRKKYAHLEPDYIAGGNDDEGGSGLLGADYNPYVSDTLHW